MKLNTAHVVILTMHFTNSRIFSYFLKKIWRDYKSVLLLHQEANTTSISLPGGGRVNHRHNTSQHSTLWEGSQVQASFILPQHMPAETFTLQCHAPSAFPQLLLVKEGEHIHTTGTWHSHKKLTLVGHSRGCLEILLRPWRLQAWQRQWDKSWQMAAGS